MNSFEKYNCIISTIEEAIAQTESEDIDPKNISDYAFEKAGLEEVDERGRNEIFKFLLGETISQYIMRRLIMLSYKVLMAQIEYDSEEIKRIVGVSSDSALYKKYKEYFNMTPKEAFDRKIGIYYEPPRYWTELSNAGKSYFVECIEKEIEIPVERIVRDRKPYLFLLLLVVLVAVLISITVFFTKRFERWGGRFDIFCKYVIESGETDFYVVDGSVMYIDPIINTIKLIDFNTDEVLLKGKVEKITPESIVWKWNGQEKTYSGRYNSENGSIECGSVYLTENSPNTGMRMFHQEDYFDIRAVWTGKFSTFAMINEAFADIEARCIYIDTDAGSLYYEVIPEEVYVWGNITFLSKDTMRFTVPALFGTDEFCCNYHVGGYFESNCPLFNPIDDYDFRFYRVTRNGVSKFQDVLDGIIARGQNAEEIGE